jgi:hypothetical protein
MKLLARTGKSPEPHPLEAVVCLQVREAHLNTLSRASSLDDGAPRQRGAHRLLGLHRVNACPLKL